MKLGIVVVYLVRLEDEKLLDLHLMQIEKYTQVPHRIYGSVNRLLPEFRHKLENQPRIKICECPDTDLRGAEEHAYYLEHLTKYAIEDGVSHVVTMHVDSFPIREGWAEELGAKLTDSCVFVTIDPSYTACLFFHRDFYLRYRPSLTISEEEKASREWAQYQLKFAPTLHSGTGYGFRAYREGLSYYCLAESIKIPYKGGIYNNMIFHLGGVVAIPDQDSETTRFFAQPAYFQVAAKISWVVRLIMPRRVREWFRRIFRNQIKHLLDSPRAQYAKEILHAEKEKLLADPETYLSRLTKTRITRKIRKKCLKVEKASILLKSPDGVAEPTINS